MWMARATISLPVPVSPRSSTVDDVCATCSTRASTSRSAGDSPTMAPKLNAPCASLDSMPTYCRQLLGRGAGSRAPAEALDGVGQDAAQLLRVPGLGDVAVDAAEVDRLDQHVDVGERGDDDADRVGAHLARRLQQLEAGHPRHALVGHDRPRRRAARPAPAPLRRCRPSRSLKALAEVEPERVQVVGLVVDDQHRIFPWSGSGAGGAMGTTVASGRFLLAMPRDSLIRSAPLADDEAETLGRQPDRGSRPAGPDCPRRPMARATRIALFRARGARAPVAGRAGVCCSRAPR